MIARQICKEENGVSIPIVDIKHEERDHNDFLIDYVSFCEAFNEEQDIKPQIQEWFTAFGYEVTLY